MPTVAKLTNNSLSAVTDDFNRADGSLGSNWLTGTGWTAFRIVSNTVDAQGGGLAILNSGVVFPSDQEAQLTLTSKQTFDYVGAVVRGNINGTGYALAIDGASNSISGLVLLNGTQSYTRILSGDWSLGVAGDIFKLRAIGSTLTVFKNDIRVAEIIDTTYPDGQPGMFYWRDNVNGTKGDNFVARGLRNLVRWSSTGTQGRIIGFT